MNKYLTLSLISGAIIALDQATKIYIHTQFRLGESITVLENFFNITYVRNFGAAFGILAESQPTFREIFFLTMPPVALIIILFILKGVEKSDKVQTVGLSLIFGGAIGNYIDRIRFQYVIDFLDFHFYSKASWPAFNVADSAIVCGVGLLLLQMVFEKKNELAMSEASAEPSSEKTS